METYIKLRKIEKLYKIFNLLFEYEPVTKTKASFTKPLVSLTNPLLTEIINIIFEKTVYIPAANQVSAITTAYLKDKAKEKMQAHINSGLESHMSTNVHIAKASKVATKLFLNHFFNQIEPKVKEPLADIFYKPLFRKAGKGVSDKLSNLILKIFYNHLANFCFFLILDLLLEKDSFFRVVVERYIQIFSWLNTLYLVLHACFAAWGIKQIIDIKNWYKELNLDMAILENESKYKKLEDLLANKTPAELKECMPALIIFTERMLDAFQLQSIVAKNKNTETDYFLIDLITAVLDTKEAGQDLPNNKKLSL